MDWRRRTFESAVLEAFNSVIERGFVAFAVSTTDVHRRPAATSVRSVGMRAESRLVIGFAGEDAVRTTIHTPDGRIEFNPGVAHTSHGMEKAFRMRAEQVHDLFHES